MIPKANITAWRSRAPWLLDEQVEQDLVLSRAIVDIFTDPLLRKELAFRGGTALHKLFFDSASRYSEDIDLVQVQAGPIGSVMNAIRSQIDPWLGKPKWKRNWGRVTLVYRFQSEVPPITQLRLKIEINTREHFNVLGLREAPLSVSNPWYTGGTEVSTYQVEELLGTKMRALYQRKKGRDLFDLATAMNRLSDLDFERIVHCFGVYMDEVGSSASRAEFEANLHQKLDDPAFLDDVQPLLAIQAAGALEGFDIRQAGDSVLRYLVARLPGEAWKQNLR